LRRHPERRVAPGETLLISGDPGARLFVLIEGEIEMSNEGMQINRQNEPGSIFGEISALLKMPYTADFKALTDSRVYQIEDGASFLRSHPEIAFQYSEAACPQAQRRERLPGRPQEAVRGQRRPLRHGRRSAMLPATSTG
jgi:CRP-like cAMP-binding protein